MKVTISPNKLKSMVKVLMVVESFVRPPILSKDLGGPKMNYSNYGAHVMTKTSSFNLQTSWRDTMKSSFS